ncbi:hemopexin family protein [Loa loa]|uniref:Hemopexin family protein n=2 Tax=Loa loa TaxID=7209 RepID=A0A1S0U7E0_LOALO|nr:hemopexin family protein [Loa loa]EFO25998.1 hemopexin family protein [Loa loa]
MFIQLLQLIIITYYVAEACLPFRILSKPVKQCNFIKKDCQDIRKNGTTIVTFQNYNCPEKIDSVTEVSGKLYIFSDGKVWILKNRRPEMVTRIDKIFPDGPFYVNASVSTKDRTYLIKDRTIFAFSNDKNIFTPIQGWPKMLPNRILFFPQAAFPIKNGSAILVSGNVLATYELKHNKVSLVYDLETYYPNLPNDFRSGIPFPAEQFNTYHFFDSHNLYEYDMNTKRITFIQPLKTYLLC